MIFINSYRKNLQNLLLNTITLEPFVYVIKKYFFINIILTQDITSMSYSWTPRDIPNKYRGLHFDPKIPYTIILIININHYQTPVSLWFGPKNAPNQATETSNQNYQNAAGLKMHKK